VDTIRPVDLPALRDEIVRSIRIPAYVDLVRERFRAHGNNHPVLGRLSAEGFVQVEAAILEDADLVFATEQMTDLAFVASESLPAFELQPEDVPSRLGLLVFAGDLPRVPHGDPPLDYRIRAYAWADIQGKGVTLLPFTDRDDAIDPPDRSRYC
jgi:hypothetical protein